MKTKLMGSFLALIISMLLLSNLGVPFAEAASQTDINDAIADGLAYLAGAQNADGSWPNQGWPAADVAMAVLAFEDAGHLPGDASDPYHTVVEKGLNYLFTRAHVQALSVQTAGNPDTNGNGIGIYFETSETTYVTPMVLMAIVASGDQARVTTTGPANVIGRTYHDIVVDIVDWLAYGQNDASTGNYRGGWRYGPNYGNSDNSNGQWPVLGLMTAELWGINAPAWVKSELLLWITYSQNLDGDSTTNTLYGSFGYESKNNAASGWWWPNNVAETAAGICMLTYCDVPKTDPRIIAAEGYLVRHWTSWNGNYDTNFNMAGSTGNLYAMFGVMKSMRLAEPTPIVNIADYAGTPTLEWYNGANQYADFLVATQQADGHWPAWIYWGITLDTAWAILILLPYAPVVVKYDFKVTVKDAVFNNPIPGANVQVVGPETQSGSTGGDGSITFMDLQAGDYSVIVSASGFVGTTVTYKLTADGELEVRLGPVAQGVPEFSTSTYMVTMLGAALYLLTKRKLSKK